jgi:hypothetical protein
MNTAVDMDTRANWEAAWREFDSSLNKKLNHTDLRMVFYGIGKDITQSKSCWSHILLQFMDTRA